MEESYLFAGDHFEIAAGEATPAASSVPAEATSRDPIRRGERTAIERIYRERRGEIERMVRNALRRAQRLTAANVADVVQDVFAKAFSERARARYDCTRDFAPFLQRIARNVLIDWLRRARRQIAKDVDLDEPECTEDLTPSPSACFPPELVDETRRYVTTLDPVLRDVYDLRFVAGVGQIEAAESLGISRQRLRTLERNLVEGLRCEISGARRPRSKTTRLRRPLHPEVRA